MNCEQCKNLMDGYLDRELDPITNQEIEQHLRDCRNCDKPTKRMARSCARLAMEPLITRRPRHCASEFNPRCGKRLPKSRFEMWKILHRCFQRDRAGRGPFLSEHPGAGWPSRLQSCSPRSLLLI